MGHITKVRLGMVISRTGIMKIVGVVEGIIKVQGAVMHVEVNNGEIGTETTSIT